MFRFIGSLFARKTFKTLIRDGVVYRQTFKGYRLVREEPVPVFGGYTHIADPSDNSTKGDRKRTDLNLPDPPPPDRINFTKKPDAL